MLIKNIILLDNKISQLSYKNQVFLIKIIDIILKVSLYLRKLVQMSLLCLNIIDTINTFTK